MQATNLIESLLEYGLTDNQAKVYLALLGLGNAPVLEIARSSEVERAHVYFILEQLLKLGLVSRSQKGKTRSFVANNPKNLISRTEQKLTRLKESLPELLALYQEVGPRPRVQIFEGKEGLGEILRDMLETLKNVPLEKREILEYVSPDSAAAALGEDQFKFIRQRIAHKIRLRWIAPDSELARGLQSEPAALREMRLVPPDRFKAATEMNVYANKINFIGSKGTAVGVIIEHSELAQTMREFFELAWRGTDRFADTSRSETK